MGIMEWSEMGQDGAKFSRIQSERDGMDNISEYVIENTE